MAFGFLKKKKEPRMELPPPPPAVELPKEEEIPTVSGAAVPEMPPLPAEAPLPEMPPPKFVVPEELPELLPSEIPPPEIREEVIAAIPKVPEHIEEVPEKVPEVERKGEIVFDKTIERKPELPTIEPGRPLFVSTQDYEAIMNGITTSKEALEKAEDVINRLNDIKNAEEKTFEEWKVHLEDIQRRLSYVDQIIVQGE